MSRTTRRAHRAGDDSRFESRIVLEGITKVYHPSPPWMRMLVRTNIRDDVLALNGVGFTVSRGEVCAVVGPNGAGKTTIFRIIVGLTTPSSGSARVMGFDATRESVAVRRLVGWMPGDDRSLMMRLNCYENLFFHGRLQGLKGKDLRRRIFETLDVVGLGHAAQKTVFALSAGMRARLQLARALLHDPEVLILDEPTGSVDPVAAHQLLELIVEVVESRGLAAMISSHRLEEIEALHASVILLDQGRVLFDGDLEDLRHSWEQKQLVVSFSNDLAAERGRLLLISRLDPHLIAIEGNELRCDMSSQTDVGLILAELEPVLPEVEHIDQLRRPLRDLLADMYEKGDERGRVTG